MKQLKAKIVDNEEMGNGFYRMRIASVYLAKEAKPGQFVEVRCGEDTDPLLRRPLGINRVLKGDIELLYEVVGKGTELLSKMKKDDVLDIIGPLGNGFIIDGKKERAILVAGGNGVAPLLFLAEKLIAHKKDVHVLIGGCSKTHILCEKDFIKAGATVSVATEDGSRGHKGLVTHLLTELLQSFDAERGVVIYACGPTGMLKAVAGIAQKKRVPCQVSLEERMACGVGVCLGCPVRIKRGHGLLGEGYEYKMVCKDGPVFNSEDVAW